MWVRSDKMSNEGFYVDKDGNKQDDWIHNEILDPVDNDPDVQKLLRGRTWDRLQKISKGKLPMGTREEYINL